jgi:hypothetical protein
MKAKSMGCTFATLDLFGLAEATLISMQPARAASRAHHTIKSTNAHAKKLISTTPSSDKKWKSL